MNTVGPYHNRQETYSFFSLPFCPGPKKDISHYHETLSEALQGVELVFSGLDIDFKGAIKYHLVFTKVIVLSNFALICLKKLALNGYHTYIDKWLYR